MSDRIFLMNQGRIVQSGDAETLYSTRGPVRRRFHRQLQPARPGRRQPPVATPGGRPPGDPPGSHQPAPDGELEGQVRSHSLLGNVIRYRVQVRGVELVVDVLNRSSADLHADGQRVSLSIDPTALREVA